MSIPVYFWFPVLGCLGLGFIFMRAPPVADQFMHMFGVEYAGLSVFLSAISWTHSAIQVPAGLFIDRLGVRRSLLACIAICCVGSLGPLLRPESLAVAIAFRLVLGVSTGMMFLLFVKVVQMLTPPQHAARVQGAQGAAFCLGTMLPYLSLSHAGATGWLAAYLSGAAFCVILALCLFRLPLAAHETARATVEAARPWQAMKCLLRSRRIWFLGCCHGFSFGTLTALGNWLSAILADTRAGSGLDDWALATSATLLIGTAGRVFSGDASRLMPRQLFIRCATLGIGVLYVLLALAHSPLVLLIPAMLLALLCGSTYAAILTLTIDSSPPTYVATAVGFMNMIANGISILLILTFGIAREFTGSFGPGLGLAALGVALLCVWGRSLDWREE